MSECVAPERGEDAAPSADLETSAGVGRLRSAPKLLKGKQRKYLRGLGMALGPSVFVGKGALTPGVQEEVATALEAHELIKVKLQESVDGDRHDVGAELALQADAELVQVIGRMILLYRRNEENPRIQLPGL